MTKSERNKIIKWANSLTDEELEKEYNDAVIKTLVCESEEMYERGYDIQDIIECEKLEKYLCEEVDILQKICCERGIDLRGGKFNE